MHDIGLTLRLGLTSTMEGAIPLTSSYGYAVPHTIFLGCSSQARWPKLLTLPRSSKTCNSLARYFVEVVKLVGGKVLVHVSKLNKDFLELFKRPYNNSSLRLLGAIATLPKLRRAQG